MYSSSSLLAKDTRELVLRLAHKHNTSHIGGSLSVVDILSVLYTDIMKINSSYPNSKKRDRLFFSKGHACMALYSILHLQGFFKKFNLLNEFSKDGSLFTSHVNQLLPGIELSTGSLGNAAGYACGVALSAKRKNLNYHSFVILSDGELNEGSNWEAFIFASHHQLNNLTFIVDCNKIQSFGTTEEVLNLEPLEEKFKSFNYNVFRIDGHNHKKLKQKLLLSKKSKNFSNIIICDTIKGRGVSFMENKLLWHYKSPDHDELFQALKEIKS